MKPEGMTTETENPSKSAYIDVEAMLAACVPGGSIADPQAIADAIRAWFAEQPAAQEAVPHAWMTKQDGLEPLNAAYQMLPDAQNRCDFENSEGAKFKPYPVYTGPAEPAAMNELLAALDSFLADPGARFSEPCGARLCKAKYFRRIKQARKAMLAASSRPAEPVAVPDSLSVGDRIEWRGFSGRWLAGTIVWCGGGTYTALLDNGWHVSRYARDHFRRLAAREGQ